MQEEEDCGYPCPWPSASCGFEQATYLLEYHDPWPENWTNNASFLPWVTHKNKRECEWKAHHMLAEFEWTVGASGIRDGI